MCSARSNRLYGAVIDQVLLWEHLSCPCRCNVDGANRQLAVTSSGKHPHHGILSVAVYHQQRKFAALVGRQQVGWESIILLGLFISARSEQVKREIMLYGLKMRKAVQTVQTFRIQGFLALEERYCSIYLIGILTGYGTWRPQVSGSCDAWMDVTHIAKNGRRCCWHLACKLRSTETTCT